MNVDAHHHVWQMDRFVFPGLRRHEVLCADHRPEDLHPQLQAAGIDATVLVQTVGNVEETRWFLQLADAHAFIRGVVGWVDLTDPAVGATLDELAAHPRLKAIRFVGGGGPDWLMREDVRRGFGELLARELAFDLLIHPQHLHAALDTARRLPSLRLVVDHIAKPNIAAKQWADWAEPMRQLAGCPNVWCKLSGMITEADPEAWQAADLRHYVGHCLEVFGPERCLFGSDWPVCRIAGEYAAVVAALAEHVQGLSAAEQAAVWGQTASDVYRL